MALAGKTIAITGAWALARRLLPLLQAPPQADIHTVVLMSGLPYARMRGSSVPSWPPRRHRTG